VPSTQPVTLRTPPRRIVKKRHETKVAEYPLPAPPTALTPMPALLTHGRARGRGILRLPALPKVAIVPTPGSRPQPRDTGLLPQLAQEVPPPPVVEFRAETPMVFDTPLESDNHLPPTPYVFQSADEDFRPLATSWADIMDQEERAAAAAATAASSAPAVTTALDKPLATVPISTTASASITTMTVTTTVTTSTVTAPDPPIPLQVAQITVDSPTDLPTVIASTPGAS